MDSNSYMEIVSLDFKNIEHIEAAARLHTILLGESPIPRLGHAFMSEFYYKVLIKDGLINCDLCRYGKEYIGFSVYTKYPFTFMEKGRKRHFLYLSFLLFRAIILKPSRIKTVFSTIELKNRRQSEKDIEKIGDILSFGVLQSYSNLRDKKTGLRASNLLIDNAICYFKNEGFRTLQAEVNKNNKPSLFLFHSYGGIVKEYDWGKKGEYVFRIEF